MAQTKPRMSGRRRLAIACLLVLALAGLVGVALLKSTPEAYERTEAIGYDVDAAARFDAEVFNKVGDVLLDRSGQTRLDATITEAMANARLARLIGDLERSGRAVPQALRDLRIGFEPGAVVLATRLGQGITSTVMSQYLALAPDAEGKLVVRPVGLRAGLAPLPGNLMDLLGRALTERLKKEQAPDPDEKTPDVVRYAVEALGGKPVALGKGKKQILVDRIEIERGSMRIQGHRALKPETR